MGGKAGGGCNGGSQRGSVPAAGQEGGILGGGRAEPAGFQRRTRSTARRLHGACEELSLTVSLFSPLQLLRLPNDCYCVLLHADMARSWRLPAPRQPGSGEAGPDSAAEQLAGLTMAQQSSEREAGSGPADASPSGNAGGISSGSSSSIPRHSARSEGGEEAALAFSGYVSHQQLTAALGGQLAGDPLLKVLRAAATAARGGPAGQPLATCRVTMKGPAGRGFADVAVASFPPDGSAAPAGSDEQQQQQHASAGAGRPNLLQRAQLLARGVKAAAQQVAGPRGGAVGAVAVEQLHLRCGLMTLQLPVDMLAQSILQALHLA